jgi:hypothetical protein
VIYSLLSRVFPTVIPVKPSIGLETTPKVVYAKPTLIPASIASIKFLNEQNFCFAISSAILNETPILNFPNSFSNSKILSAIPLDSI